MPPGWREQYDRVKRWHARLGESTAIDDRRADDFYAFFVFCYHLKDWLQKDESIPADVRAEVEPIFARSVWMKICADVANGVKHLIRDRPPRFDAKARVEQVEAFAQPGLFQSDTVQSEQIIVVADNAPWAALQVADKCVASWSEFLKSKALI